MSASSRQNCYLLLGPDRERKRQRLSQLTQALQVHLLDQQRVPASALPSMNIGALLRQHPLASRLRLVVIEDAQKIAAAQAALMQAQWAAAAHVACLVLLIDGELTAHLRALAEQGTVERFGLAAPVAKPFALVEAIARRDTAAALEAMHEQLRDGKEEVELVGLLVWQLQRWLSVQRGLEAGWSGERAASLAGIKPWQTARVLEEAAQWPIERLSHLLQQCWDVDVGIKTGKLAPRVALEALLVRMCLSRPEGRDVPPAPSGRAAAQSGSRSSGGA